MLRHARSIASSAPIRPPAGCHSFTLRPQGFPKGRCSISVSASHSPAPRFARAAKSVIVCRHWRWHGVHWHFAGVGPQNRARSPIVQTPEPSQKSRQGPLARKRPLFLLVCLQAGQTRLLLVWHFALNSLKFRDREPFLGKRNPAPRNMNLVLRALICPNITPLPHNRNLSLLAIRASIPRSTRL